jgi:hypothetical protein
MKKAILWLLFTIAAASAWEDDDYDNDDGICPLAVCHGKYVDTQYDIHHCGECDIKCFPNQICIHGICTCPNNNNACGSACTPCPIGQHCELVNGAYACVCDNTPNSCGTPDPNSGICPICTGTNTPSCCDGTCTCPNTPTQCTNGNSGAGTCSTCNVASGEVCVNGACGCCITTNGTTSCTQCPMGSTSCTSGGTAPGTCCLPDSNICTDSLDCCNGSCNGGLCCTILTIGFDDLPGSGPVPSGYNTLNWLNVDVSTAINASGPGYVTGIVSPPNAAFNGFGTPAKISRVTPFSVISVYATAAFDIQPAESVIFTASNGAILTQAINTAAPIFITFPDTFIGITSITFVGSGGFQLVLDDLTVCI